MQKDKKQIAQEIKDEVWKLNQMIEAANKIGLGVIIEQKPIDILSDSRIVKVEISEIIKY